MNGYTAATAPVVLQVGTVPVGDGKQAAHSQLPVGGNKIIEGGQSRLSALLFSSNCQLFTHCDNIFF